MSGGHYVETAAMIKYFVLVVRLGYSNENCLSHVHPYSGLLAHCVYTTTDALLCFFTQTREQVSMCPKGHLTPSLVCQSLTEEQWAQLDQINDELTKEYSVRRQMLLTRCDVTVQSFRWSDKVKVGHL